MNLMQHIEPLLYLYYGNSSTTVAINIVAVGPISSSVYLKQGKKSTKNLTSGGGF